MQKNVNKVESKLQKELTVAQRNFNAVVAKSVRKSTVHAVINGVVMSVRDALSYDYR